MVTAQASRRPGRRQGVAATDGDLLAMLRLRRDGLTYEQLGAEFGVSTTAARMRLLSARAATLSGAPAIAAPVVLSFRLELDMRSVRRGERRVCVGRCPARILALLMRHPGRLVSHADIATELYGGAPPSSSVVRVFVLRLRQALRDLGCAERIASLRGDGYVLERPQ